MIWQIEKINERFNLKITRLDSSQKISLREISQRVIILWQRIQLQYIILWKKAKILRASVSADFIYKKNVNNGGKFGLKIICIGMENGLKSFFQMKRDWTWMTQMDGVSNNKIYDANLKLSSVGRKGWFCEWLSFNETTHIAFLEGKHICKE